MNEAEGPIDQQPADRSLRDEHVVSNDGEVVRHEEEISPVRRRVHPGLIAALMLAVVVVFLLAWYFISSSGEAGKPVPAPRTSVSDGTPAATLTNQTLTLSPDQVQNAGITIETVGEQLSTE